ncbi:hypothetical protein TCSYLVIO_009034 [Trypanosoma cruzi]|nr:hypothetical protein TCSYLVIO_009034 [Trypanosoma cruzi]
MLRWVVKEVESPYGNVATVHWAVDDGDDDNVEAATDALDASLQQQLEDAEDQLGAVLWNSNAVALRYLHEHVLRDKASAYRVVELGAGVGCLGIALAMAGARVVITDLKELLPLMQKNIEMNAARIRLRSNGQGSCTALALRWGPPPRLKKRMKKQQEDEISLGSKPKETWSYAGPSPSFLALQQELDRVDMVVLCDALYGNARDWPQLLYTLSEILAANPSCEVINFCEQRVKNVEGDFLRLLQQENSKSVASDAEDGKENEEESLESALTRMRGAYEWWSATEVVREGTSDLGMTVCATRIRWVPRRKRQKLVSSVLASTSPLTAVVGASECDEGLRGKRRRTKL